MNFCRLHKQMTYYYFFISIRISTSWIFVVISKTIISCEMWTWFVSFFAMINISLRYFLPLPFFHIKRFICSVFFVVHHFCVNIAVNSISICLATLLGHFEATIHNWYLIVTVLQDWEHYKTVCARGKKPCLSVNFAIGYRRWRACAIDGHKMEFQCLHAY